MRDRTPVQSIAALVGLVFLLVGILGFIPGITTHYSDLAFAGHDSGAKLLGPITIGHGAKIGANAVVIHEVPPNSTVVGNPGHPVRIEGRKPEGPDADWVHLPDPIADALKQMATRVALLERELAMLRGDEPSST